MPPANGEKQRPDVPVKPEPDARQTTRSATGMVVVGCKIPNGVILQLSVFEQNAEPVMGGGHRDVKIGRKVGQTYTVRGPNVKFGEIPRFLMAGGYALTSGIPEDFWNTWLEQNKDAEMVKRELIVAYKSMDDVEAHCSNNETLKTGLEPMDPQNLPRGIMTAEEQAKRTAVR